MSPSSGCDRILECPECVSEDVTVHSKGNTEVGEHYHCNAVRLGPDGEVEWECGNIWYEKERE